MHGQQPIKNPIRSAIKFQNDILGLELLFNKVKI